MQTAARERSAPSPLRLLFQVNALQGWRRLKDLRQRSALLTTIIGLFVGGYLAVAFGLFYKGLHFLNGFPGIGPVVIERLFYLMFAFLFGMLLLSNLVIAYTNFFRNRESAFLLSLPVTPQEIFRWKFLESAALASWAFVFLIAPLVAAFGLTRGVPWHFYLVTPVLVGLFIVLPGVLGAWLAIGVARYLDRRTFQVALIAALLALAAFATVWWKTSLPSLTDDVSDTRVLGLVDHLFARTGFAQFPFLPSFWISASVLQWADGAFTAAGFFMLVLLSYTALFGFVAFTRFGHAFYDGASATQSRAGAPWGDWSWLRPRKARTANLTGTATPGRLEKLAGVLKWLPPDTRALLVKDARMFWRDTSQWGQTVMLFGLLAVYIVNLRNFTHQLSNPFWINLVAFLNLGACSLNLATVTTRFVFPQFSLEGRRLWIIGMAPMGLRRAVRIKYLAASFTALVVTLSLMVLTCRLLNMSALRTAFFSVVVTVMTFSLNGVAVGLGVLYPNLKESNPGKIVSGFGGTLCLVASFLYILGSVLLLAFGAGGWHERRDWLLASLAAFAALSWLVGWVPLKMAFKQLEHMEI